MTDTLQAVDAHYRRAGLGQTILAALRAAGKSIEPLDPDDLAAIDHFHVRGREATVDLARLAGIRAGMRVIDVGGGLGGPARLVARQFGCEVTVLDATQDFCRVGADLTRRTGLGGRVRFQYGSAVETGRLPGEFDVAWLQHASMNIPDKVRLYSELRRVTRSGGHLALHEVMAGPIGPIRFPVPWARDDSLSSLLAPADVRYLLVDVGFDEVVWDDESALALEWLHRRLAAGFAERPPSLGLHLLLGGDHAAMITNLARNLEDKRLRVIKAVWRRR